MVQQKLQVFRRRLIDSLAVAAAFAPGFALANPAGGVVVAGAASIDYTSTPNTVRIEQTSSAAVINWQDFSIGGSEFVQFSQPGSDAATLNRVTGNLPSSILGTLSANGRVFIINPQGVMFGATARVDTAALVATTFDIADNDFMNGQYAFAGDPANTAAVVNQGEIVVTDGGFVVLAGSRVSNEGLVQARLGSVALLSGSAMTLSLDANGLVGYTLDADALGDSTGAFNSGDLLAHGGQVVMSARVARTMAGQAVNNSGRISATSIQDQAGVIYLSAHGGDLGPIGDVETAGAAGQPGGEIIVEADSIAVGNGPAAGCAATVCEQQLEGLLGQGTSIGLIARDNLTVADLADGQLEGRSGTGSGGFLLMGIGTNNDGAGYVRGSDGSVSFADSGDQLLLDSGVQAYAGTASGTLTVGDILGREFIILEAADDLQAGALTHADSGSSPSLSLFSQNGGIVTGAIDARNNVYIEAAGNVAVNGNIKVVGSIASADPQSFSVIGSRLEILSHGGGIAVNGGLEQVGNVDSFGGNDAFAVRGSYAEFDAGDGDVLITGPVSMQGTIGSVTGNSDWSAIGSQLTARARGGVVQLQGSVQMGGSVGSALGNARIAVRGSEMSLGSAVDDGRAATTDVIVGGPVTMTGSVGTFFLDNNGEAIGSFFQIGAIGGEARVDGTVSVSGTVNELGASHSVSAIGGFAEFVADGGKIDIGSSFDVSGSVASAGAGTGLTVNGASLLIQQRSGDVHFGGAVQVEGQIELVGANDEAEVRAADFVVTAVEGNIVADSSLYAEGRAQTVGVGSSSFNNGVFINLSADGDVQLGGDVSALGILAEVGAGSGVQAQAALLKISGQNILADGSVVLGGGTREIGAGDSVFTSGASLELSAVDDIRVDGDLGVIGQLGPTASAGDLVARAADLIVHASNIGVGGEVLVDGTTASVDATGTSFAAGGYLELVASGDATIGSLRGVGSIESFSGGDSSGAQALDLHLEATGGTLTVLGNVDVEGHNGSAFLGNSGTSNGVQLLLRGGSVDLQGGLRAVGSLDATDGGDSLSAEATSVEIRSTDALTIAGDTVVEGVTGTITAGASSTVSGSLVDLQASGSLLLGGSLSVTGMLESVQGPDPSAPPEGLYARASNVALAAFGDRLDVVGDINLNGSTGEVVAGSNSFSNGVFLGVVASGVLQLHGDINATASLDSTRAGDFLFAEAAEIALNGGDVLIDGDINLSGNAGLVEGGFDTYAAGSFLSLEATSSDIVVLGEINARGSLATDSSFSVFGESHAQGVALVFKAPNSIHLDSDVTLNGQTGSGLIGFNSFANGSLLQMEANIVRLQGNLTATGTLGDLEGFSGLDAEAADVLIDALLIELAGDVSLDGSTGNVRTGNASVVSGSFLRLRSGFGVTLGGDLNVTASLASVTSSDPDGIAADNLVARATSVQMLNQISGAVSIAGNVDLQGSTGMVEGGVSSFSNGVFLQLSAVDQDFTGLGNVVIGGSLTADGHLGSTTADSGLFARATEINLRSSSGNVEIGGPVTLTGSNDAVQTAHQSSVSAISVNLQSLLGNVVLSSDFHAEGTLGDVRGFSQMFARATELIITTDAGSLLAGGSITATGTTGSVDTTHSSFINATSVELNLQNGGAEIAGDLTTSGMLGRVGAEDESFARGTELVVKTLGGDFHLGGDLVTTGSTGDVAGFDNGATAFNAVGVNGAYVELQTVSASTRIDGDVSVTGMLGSFTGEQFSFASGAEFLALPDGEFRVGGNFTVDGTLGAFTALDGSGVFGADVFIFSGSESQPGDTSVGGGISVTGSLQSVNAGNDLYSYGAFASFSSLHGDVQLEGPVEVHGTIGNVVSGDNLDLSGAGFWADAKAGSVQLTGPLDISGSVQQVDAANGAFLNGAFAYLTAVGGNLDVNGDLSLQGTMTSVSGDSAIAASGADLLLERSADVPGGGLTVNGNIVEQGSISSFEVADLTNSSRFNGGVLLNANDGSIALRNVTADNAFIYFNQDSSLGQSQLTALEYLEIVTPSGAPTLTADSLTITAPEVFISANIDAGTLAVEGADSLAVSAARLHADNLSLTSEGLLQLADDSETTGVTTEISGGSVQLSGGRVISDAGTVIDAGGLDVVATDTIRLAGHVRVGTGLAQAGGDATLLQQLGETAPELVPLSARPNAYFRASTVALAELELAGDYLHIEADTMRLGTLTLQDGTFVHFDPLRNLPFFTESVDVTDAGLDSVKDRLATENNRVIPNLGPFNNGDDMQELGDRPVLSDSRTDQTGDPQFQVGGAVQNLGQLVLQTGLANNTVVIGGSDYTAAIQIADQLVVDVLPSETDFIFATSSKVLITEPIRTNGQVIVLGGGVETDRSTFYSTVVDQINSYYEALEPDTPDEDDGEVEEKSSDGQECAS